MAEAHATTLLPEHRAWRTKVFIAAWLSYVGFYFCRKPFSAAKAAIGAETHWNATTLGNIWAAYLVTYALGQFVAAAMGTRFGPRKNVLAGMAISVVVTLAMTRTLDIGMMAVLVGLNGLAQATGWSGNVGTMAGWFHKHERGRVLGAWANCFTVGALTSGWTMAAVLNNRAPGQPAPWRDCFLIGAAVLGAAWLVFFLFQRNDPESAGLPPIPDPHAGEAERAADNAPRSAGLGLSRSAWTNLLLVAGFYFFAKFIRYAVWSWAAYFLERNFGLTGARANVYATGFDLLGIPGIYLTGWISDRFFSSRRAGVATMMMLAMTASTALLMMLGSTSVGVFAVLLGLVGFTLYGPDALLTSAGAIDIGNRRAATFTTAVISGFGSFGAIVQELVIARSYDASKGQLGPIMAMLFGSAAVATLFCAVLVLRNRRGGRGL